MDRDDRSVIGATPDRPFRILGITTEVTMGDLICNVVFWSSLANQFAYSKLHVKFRDVRPYSRDVMSLSPWIDRAEPLPGEWPKIVRKFFPRWKPRRPPDVGRLNTAQDYDMVVTNQMARGTTIQALPNPVPLRLPPDRRDDLQSRLVSRGLNPNSWFGVIHYRESTYEFRRHSGERDSTPAAFDNLVDHIIALGGQVVRLGHPDMTAFKPRRGFIDLSREPNSFMLQATAVSHARFMIAGPSGPSGMALAFAVPNTLVDAADSVGPWGPDHNDILTHEVTTPDGEILRNASLREAGLLSSHRLLDIIKTDARHHVRKATADELRIVASRLYERTSDCPAWRPPAKIPDTPKPNRIIWPLRPAYRMRWLNL